MEWNESHQKFRCRVCRGDWKGRHSLPGHAKSKLHLANQTTYTPINPPATTSQQSSWKVWEECFRLHHRRTNPQAVQRKPNPEVFKDSWAQRRAEEMLGDGPITAGIEATHPIFESLQEALSSQFMDIV